MGRRCNRDKPNKRTSKPSALSMFTTYVAGEKRSARKPFPHSRSYAPRKLRDYEINEEQRGRTGERFVDSEIFYDGVTGTSYGYQPKLFYTVPKRSRVETGKYDAVDNKMSTPAGKSGSLPVSRKVAPLQQSGFKVTASRCPDTYSSHKKKEDGEENAYDERDGDEVDLIPDALEHVFDNSNRHSIGLSILSKVFGSGEATKAEGFAEDRDSRPFFTYWISIVQIIIFIVVVATYGIAPYGTGLKTVTDQVLQTSQTIEKVTKEELTNFWIGPRFQDLIHVGARYSMCMRNDTNLKRILKKDKQLLNQTACCVQNDGSGCLQTSEAECSDFLSTWFKYGTEINGEVFVSNDLDGQRTSGSVCGQDPVYCKKPSYEWPDDITEWPKCEKDADVSSSTDDYHMTCELLGRPCCIGIQGECKLTTPEDCEFQDGYFHEDATMCSQVSCMEDVCGMLPFTDPNTPDQFYRLLSTMFLHAGFFDLFITVLIQVIFMRDLEKLISAWRVVIIYIGSSVCGSLASATFIPYYVEAGPSGAIYGVLAALYLELLRFERRVKNPQIWKVILKMALSLVVLFVIGLFLPSIDNFAHFFGFLFGLLIAFALRPYQVICNFRLETWTLVIIGIVTGLIAAGLFAIFVVIFYVADQVECDACINLNCIPFTDTYCDSIKIRLRDN